MMVRIKLSFRTRSRQQFTRCAEEIAERCRGDVSRRLTGLSATMSQAEARGYIRTRSAVVVHRQVDLMMKHDKSLRPADRAKLIELATDRLVESLLKSAAKPKRHQFAA